MSIEKPDTRTEANDAEATQHLTEEQKQALDANAEAEHSHGNQREKLTREGAQLRDGGGEN